VLVLPPFAEELNKSRRMLSLAARALQSAGIEVLQRIDCGADVRGGTPGGATTQIHAPDRERRVTEVVDAASAALMYVRHDPRVSHLVLVNPWVSSSAGQAQAYLDAYYGRKFRSPGFWRRMAVDASAALTAADGFLLNLRLARQAPEEDVEINEDDEHFLVRMLAGANTFRGRVLLLLSGRDLVATEFELLLERSDEWRNALAPPRVVTRKLPEATHTFSRQVWRDWTAAATADFIA